MGSLFRTVGLAFVGISSLATVLRAGDLFQVIATPTTGAPVTASGKSVVDLVKDVVDTQNNFASLANSDFNSSLTYAGLKDAITFSQAGSAGNRTVTLTIPSTGFAKTFTDTGSKSVQDQIADFLKKDGASEVAKFIQKMNQITLAGVTDGNPLATTALMSKETFNRFGIRQSPFQLKGEGVEAASDGGFELRLDASAGQVDIDAGKGYLASVSLSTAFRFGDTVSLVLTTPVAYRDLEGSAIFQAGEIVGLPIRLIPGKGDNSLSWTLTPSGLVAVSGSADLVSGGFLWGANLTSSLTYTVAGFNITLANQYGLYQGIPVTYGDYRFETDVDQQILRNGVQIGKSFGEAFIDAGIAYTNFLNDAAIDGFWSPTVGVGVRFGKGQASGLRLGYAGDFGNGFTVNGAEMNLFFSF